MLRVGSYRTTDWHGYHMWEPSSVVPSSIMPSYKHMFTNVSDIDTAYAEAYTVKTVFNVPYDKENMPSLGTLEQAQEQALKEARVIGSGIKNTDVKNLLDSGKIPEVVALIAYLNSLK
ncbi:Cytochrome c oxidase subunit CcoO [hydrothermal vent metagenome]|uniref:Cytochrome c oxidase subunit CcoO n=1 Tax=hydrothermal vent metagenome TaxID=652676 RepID=A0A3B1DUM9_9ZZZZ